MSEPVAASRRRRRLHWGWHTAIALLVGGCYGGIAATWTTSLYDAHARAVEMVVRVTTTQPAGAGLGVAVAWFVPVMLIAFGVYGLLTVCFARMAERDGETRCRRCAYILRGISEPRCPECGERI